MAILLVETEDDVQRVALDRERLTIGRLPANDVVISSQRVSRFHAELRRGPDGWWITDLDSTNGIRVDGQRVARHALRAGERVELAPGIQVALTSDGSDDDIAVRPTAYVPAVAAHGPQGGTTEQGAGVAHAWLPPSSATAWAASGAGVRGSGKRSGGPPLVEGDLFRRKRVRMSGGPITDAPPGSYGPIYGATAALLHLCRTCGQQTAPDNVLCQACGTVIASECGACRMSLLPIQDVCPRCQSQNPDSVLRARRTPTPP